MKSIKYIFFLLLIFIIGTSIYIATLDGKYNVQVNRTMKVPAALIFNNINDYKNWPNWDPWFEIDKTMVASFPENTSGVGASFNWMSKDGGGNMKTLSLIPNKELIQEINFGYNAKDEVYWNLEQIGDSTNVIWGMRGELSFSEKTYWLIKGGLEKYLTPMHMKGLKLLEQELLKEMDKHSVEFKGIVEYGGGFYLYKTVSCKTEEAGENIAKIFPEIFKYVSENAIIPSGKPFTLNHQIDLQNNTVLFSICVPIKERILTNNDVLTGYLEPQKTFKTVFKGNYKFLTAIWPKIYNEISDQGLTPVQKGFSFEIYTISPNDNENPAEWLTEIYVPIE